MTALVLSLTEEIEREWGSRDGKVLENNRSHNQSSFNCEFDYIRTSYNNIFHLRLRHIHVCSQY